MFIGFAGRKNTGKDTAGAYLVEKYGYSRHAFADALKALALRINPMLPLREGDWWDGDLEELSHLVSSRGWDYAKDEFPEVRRYLQTLGSALREMDQNFWVYPLIDLRMAPLKPMVITDVRYINEAEFVRDEGGHVIKLVRDGVDTGDDHESETSVDSLPVCATIVNDGSMEDLHRRIEEVLGGQFVECDH